MDPASKNIFQQFLMEGFEKQKDKKNIDVVAEKRTQLNTMINAAHNELRNKSYLTAAKQYFNAINLLKTDPYPDEFQLSEELEFTIKCCFSYSTLKNPERFAEAESNTVLLDVIRELNDKFRTCLFPMYLLVLLNFHRKDWLGTLTWSNEIAKYGDEPENPEKSLDLFRELLPRAPEIRIEVENYEEVAFFSYGERLLRNTLLNPRLQKYKDWVYKLDDFIASKVVKFPSPISEIDLHVVFHHEIYPVWCIANDIDFMNSYTDKFVTKCKLCTRGKLHRELRESNEKPSPDQIKFEKYVDQCVQFYQKYAFELVFNEDEMRSGKIKQVQAAEKPASPQPVIKVKSVQTLEAQARNMKAVLVKKQICSISTQTEKLKTNNKIVQTDVKAKNLEVHPNNDIQVLNAVLEIKNKYLAIQEKKDDIITKLNKKISELHEKINKDTTARNAAEQEFEKTTTNMKIEIQRLKDQIAEQDKKQKLEREVNVSLQKLLMEQVNDKYSMHKQHYKIYEHQAHFMVTYLNDLVIFLTPKSIPNDRTCRMHIGMWEEKLKKIREESEQLNGFYQTIRLDMINSGIFDVLWPELPELPKYEENFIFICFKAAIKNIIETEEKLFWKYKVDCQTQIQRQQSVAAPVSNNFPYAFQRAAQFQQQPQQQQQNNVYGGTRYVYSNSSAVPARFLFQQQQQQPAAVQQTVRRDRLPDEITMPITPSVAVEPRRNLDDNTKITPIKKVGKLPGKTTEAVSPTKAACGVVKKKEKEMILLDYVLEHCPGATEEEVTLALLNLLEENKGTLSNISTEKVVEDVKVLLRMKKQTAWVTPKSPHIEWHNEHTEKECSICFEEFSLFDKYTLPCQHEYHKECIKTWLRTSSVCPICRIHSVIDEDFPPLH